MSQEIKAAQRLMAFDHKAKKELERKFEDQLKKEGIHGVEITFISNDELNVFSEDRRAFDRAKAVLKKVPNLRFKNEEVDNDPDFDGPQYHAWYKF